MDKIKKAHEFFSNGFNCGTSVFAVFAQDYGMDLNTALRVSGALGGGLARTGETCGAVSGALLVLGLKHGMTEPNDVEAKENLYKQTSKYLQKFKERYNVLTCRELLGYNTSIPEEAAQIKALDLHNTKCSHFIQAAVEILEEMQTTED